MSNQATVTASGVAVVNAAETAVVTSDVIPSGTGASFEGVEIRGVCNILAGASTTAVVLRVRQGSGVGGTVIGAARTHTLAAGASASIPFCELDTTPAAAGQQYTLTATQTGGAANGTANATITSSPSSRVVG